MKSGTKKLLAGALGVAVILVGGAVGFVALQVRAADASLDRVWDVPIEAVTASKDEAVIARGKHLAESFAGCAGSDCHAKDLGGGTTLSIGPMGDYTGPNITMGGLGSVYSDGELDRLIRHGIKKDGRSVRFMPVQEISWLPRADRVAIISYLRATPSIERPNGPVRVGMLAKVLDQRGEFPLDIARHITHGPDEAVPDPEPTAAYGKFVVRACTGCHGEHLSGGRIPGAPAEIPIPLNLTPHPSGMAGWTFEDFDKLATTGVRKNGKELDPFMPRDVIANMNEIERKATFAYLASLPPSNLGGR